MSRSTDSLLSGSASPNASSSAAVSQWEALRKKSRLLETQLYKKLQELSQIQTDIMNEGRNNNNNARAGRADLELSSIRSTSSSSSSSSSTSSAGGSGATSASSPLLLYETCVTEITDLLRSFSEVVEGLSRLLADTPSLANDANNYTLSKFRQVLNDSSLEFRRTKQNIQAALARKELMSGARERKDADQSLRPRTEQLLREEKSLHHSLTLTDEVLAQAVSARDSLLGQGNVFSGVRGKLSKLGTTFPVVGALMNKISMKQNRDMVVIACVIAVCMMFTFLYIMSKA